MSGSISSAVAEPCNKAKQCVPSSVPWEAEISGMGEEASVGNTTQAALSWLQKSPALPQQ